jgi:hypothetical protein
MNGDRSFLGEATNDIERKAPPGQIAVVLTGLALGILLMGIQLWLLTIALDRYLAGQGTDTWLLAVISGLVFLGGLLVLRMLARQPHLTPRRGR